MLDAMMSAKVGDDVFGEDEAVNSLQRHAAEMFGGGIKIIAVSSYTLVQRTCPRIARAVDPARRRLRVLAHRFGASARIVLPSCAARKASIRILVRAT
jgi:threonine aldolase